jgi:preprotein translocase subunit SecG
LMQRPKQEGLGAAFASGMMQDSFGAQTTDVLQKGTRILAIAFFVLSISLAIIKAQETRALRESRQKPAPEAVGGAAQLPGGEVTGEMPAPVLEPPATEPATPGSQPAPAAPETAPATPERPGADQGAATPPKEGAATPPKEGEATPPKEPTPKPAGSR